MSCECYKKTQDKIIEHFKSQKPQAEGVTVKLLGYGFAVDGKANLTTRPICPIEILAKIPAKGGMKLVKVKQNLYATYCPICGLKVDE